MYLPFSSNSFKTLRSTIEWTVAHIQEVSCFRSLRLKSSDLSRSTWHVHQVTLQFQRNWSHPHTENTCITWHKGLKLHKERSTGRIGELKVVWFQEVHSSYRDLLLMQVYFSPPVGFRMKLSLKMQLLDKPISAWHWPAALRSCIGVWLAVVMISLLKQSGSIRISHDLQELGEHGLCTPSCGPEVSRETEPNCAAVIWWETISWSFFVVFLLLILAESFLLTLSR